MSSTAFRLISITNDEAGDKIRLPPETFDVCAAAIQHSARDSVASEALLLQLSGGAASGCRLTCTVRDFTAPARSAVVPAWMLRELGISAGGLLIVQLLPSDGLHSAVQGGFSFYQTANQQTSKQRWKRQPK
jgi:hypothetical protein